MKDLTTHKLNWNKLLSKRRPRDWRKECAGEKPYTHTLSQDHRTEFQKDYHRIIQSASFRRLQDKAQVFPLERSDFVRTRLTHSLEVASYAKSLGQTCFKELQDRNIDEEITPMVREQCCQILECAGLLHDIGNPPFGHFGEDAIRAWFVANIDTLTDYDGSLVKDRLTQQMKEDFYHFEGNAQALRLVSKLHYLVDENGMNLTYALLNTLIKYPVDSCHINKKSGNIKDKKMGYYHAEEDLFFDIVKATGATDCRYPLTYLLEAADDIAYKTADIEDAVKKGFISYHAIIRELDAVLFGDNKEFADDPKKAFISQAKQKLENFYERALSNHLSNPEVNAVQNWVVYVQGRLLFFASDAFVSHYHEIMNGVFNKELLAVSDGDLLCDLLSDIALRYVFRSQEIFKLEIAAKKMFTYFLDHLVIAAIASEDQKMMGLMDLKWFSLISDNYRQCYEAYAKNKSKEERLYLRLLLVTDYICGMTDSFAKQTYQELMGIV